MKVEKGVVIAAYKQSHGGRRYVVLQRTKNWEGWELPKGNLEEDYRETALQELEEEAGIDEDQVEDVLELDETVSWEYEREGEERRKEYRVFIVRVKPEAAVDVSGNPHDEHEQGFFLSPGDAKSLLTYDNQVKVLEKAEEQVS